MVVTVKLPTIGDMNTQKNSKICQNTYDQSFIPLSIVWEKNDILTLYISIERTSTTNSQIANLDTNILH